MTIKDLQPSAIWGGYFYDITQIPRPSKRRNSCLSTQFARQHNLEAKQDGAGNILIIKPASEGKENVPAVVLQSHVDMVCEKTQM